MPSIRLYRFSLDPLLPTILLALLILAGFYRHTRANVLPHQHSVLIISDWQTQAEMDQLLHFRKGMADLPKYILPKNAPKNVDIYIQKCGCIEAYRNEDSKSLIYIHWNEFSSSQRKSILIQFGYPATIDLKAFESIAFPNSDYSNTSNRQPAA